MPSVDAWLSYDKVQEFQVHGNRVFDGTDYLASQPLTMQLVTGNGEHSHRVLDGREPVSLFREDASRLHLAL